MMMSMRKISESQHIHEVSDDKWAKLRSRHREIFSLLFLVRLVIISSAQQFRGPDCVMLSSSYVAWFNAGQTT